MFQPLSVFLGLRYVRSRQHKFFVSLITWVSLAGVALGVAALIVILSVMNGFEGELRERLLSLSAQAHVMAKELAAPDGERALRERLQRLPGVVGVAPYIELTGAGGAPAGYAAGGAARNRSALEPRVSRRAAAAGGGEHRCAAARQQRRHSWPRHRRSARGARRRSDHACWCRCCGRTARPNRGCASSRSAACLQAGLEDHDNTLILAHIDDVRAFAPLAQGASGLRLRFTDPLQVGQVHAGGTRGGGPRLHWHATGRRRTPATFAPSASRRP